ncbi:hypothetical protein AB205_0046150 [Aquarana catesbeiana]|uniref:Uncharacterized protein n=1 Tax=Aquarana catesbeiana TaxID=8400 RepID=A0A2G9QB67_AQUCT|nr:hypothetical protein AB205_0046150 [Aquarana catesbeiana]
MDKDVVFCQSSQGPCISEEIDYFQEEDSGHMTLDESSNHDLPKEDEITFVQNDQEIQDVPSDGDDTMSTKNHDDLLSSSSSRQVFNSSTVGDMLSALMQCCADLQTRITLHQ